MSKHSLDSINASLQPPRRGCRDVWNAFMVKEASFTPVTDIPICNSIIKDLPEQLISYDEAKTLYKKNLRAGKLNFHNKSFVHFYIDDNKFDGKQSSIWLYPEKALQVISHFDGIITPDFSTNVDFPDPWKRFNTYRMRAFGCWMNQLGIKVINNVRWGSLETWQYCFDGIPRNSIVSIGTVASGLKHLSTRSDFEIGLYEMVHTLQPCTIIVYGSDRYPFFDALREQGIEIIPFPSRTNEAFIGRNRNE